MKKLIHPSKIEWLDGGYSFNPYSGCAHSCRYNPIGQNGYGCYARQMAWRYGWPHWETWNHPTPTTTMQEITERLPRELDRIPAGKKILLSSMTDSYQPLEAVFSLTRAALPALSSSDKHIIVLTKSFLVIEDIPLFSGRKNVEVGFTLTCSDSMAEKYEPGAPRPSERINALAHLSEKGVNTFVSLEPWMPGITDPIGLIQKVQRYTNKIILGSLNHAGVDKSFYREKLPRVEEYCTQHGIELLVKKELRRAVER